MKTWELLGIEATTELSAIKSAYAARAREVHPEEHPEEFQRLQAAYKAAVKYAKLNKSTAEKIPVTAGEAAPQPDEAAFPSEEAAPQPDETVFPSEETASQPEENTISNDTVSEPSGGEEQMFDFNYDEIEGQTLNDQFFAEFFPIAWNPWLMNNLDCWALFLGQPRYAQLFQNSDFRKNLVQSMCYLSGWHRKTIRYFDAFLKKFQTEDNGRSETELFLWKRKKYKLWNKGIFTVERFVTSEQKALHEVLLAEVSRKFFINNLKKKNVSQTFSGNRQALLAYLKTYSHYAPKRFNHLEKLYQANKQGRLFLKTFFFFSALFLLFLCYINYMNLPG